MSRFQASGYKRSLQLPLWSESKDLILAKEFFPDPCLAMSVTLFSRALPHRDSIPERKGWKVRHRVASAPLARPNTEIHLPFALWSFHRPRTERWLCNAATVPLRVVISQTGTPRSAAELAENIPRRRSHARACFPDLDGGSNVPALAFGLRSECAAPGSYFDVFAWI